MRILFGIFLGIVLTINLSAQETGCIEGDCENGYGVYKTSLYTYYGDFLDGKKHFWGCQDYESNKQVYCGNYSQGNKHLIGTYYFYDGDNDFFMGIYDRNKQKRTGFYIDASAADNGAISMRRDALKIKPKYTPAKDGIGCVDGDCENGNGVYVYKNGEIYSGGFFEGEWNGWGCYQFFHEDEGVVNRIYCGLYKEGRSYGTGFNFISDEDSYSFDGGSIENTLDFEIGLSNGTGDIKTGIHTADISDAEERNSLQYKFGEGNIGNAKPSGATSRSDKVCLLGNCKNSNSGFSITSSYNNGDFFGYEYTGNQINMRLNGYGCQYFPKHPKLIEQDDSASSEFLYCGNFIDGSPMYYGTTYFGGSSVVDTRFYFGLHDGFSWVKHGVYAYKNGNDGWVIETANYNEE